MKSTFETMRQSINFLWLLIVIVTCFTKSAIAQIPEKFYFEAGVHYRFQPIIFNDRSLSPIHYYSNGYYIDPAKYLDGPGIYLTLLKELGWRKNYTIGLSTTLRYTVLYYKENQYGFVDFPVKSLVYDVSISARHRLLQIPKSDIMNHPGSSELWLGIAMGLNGGGSAFMSEFLILGGTGFIGIGQDDLIYSSGDISLMYKYKNCIFSVTGHLVLSNDNIIWLDPPPIVPIFNFGYQFNTQRSAQ